MTIENTRSGSETLELLANRASVRKYADREVSEDTRNELIRATASAPTAGAMMLYSIIDVRDQSVKDRLAVLCDNQPFIAKAPLVYVFAADWRKWLDLFAASDCAAIPDVVHRDTVGSGDLLLALQDAIIAAQTMVIAAEALGLGTCYIGDIIENQSEVAELLHLPSATLPACMLVGGYPHKQPAPTPHATRGLVMRDHYTRAPMDVLTSQIEERETYYPTRWNRAGVTHNVHALYARKFTSAFMAEMNESAQSWLRYWNE
ncbi:MAG: nitroreductase family protein [Actinomycetes bacterium]|jgi:nitroreductase|nr:nitroreductase family protein [Actinomycetes bacterium]